MRELCCEICLTAPARLASLLPYIQLQLQAVLNALASPDDGLVKLGLRTLEFWVENLNPDFLGPLLQPNLNAFTRALCALLQPSPSSIGNVALQVGGKR